MSLAIIYFKQQHEHIGKGTGHEGPVDQTIDADDGKNHHEECQKIMERNSGWVHKGKDHPLQFPPRVQVWIRRSYPQKG